MQATPDRVFTDSVHPCNFYASHLSLASLSPTKTLKYLLPVTTLIPMPRKKSSALNMFFRATTNILFAGFEKYPRYAPLACRSWNFASMRPKSPPSVLPVYHGWVTQGCAYQSSPMRGMTHIMYTIMAEGYPWVMPSLLCKKWPDLSSMSHTTRVAQ